MKEKKTYVTKLGLRFQINNQSLPFKDGIVTFTQEEYDWLVKNNYTGDSEEFTFIWNAKKENFNYPMIPTQDVEKQANMGFVAAGKIIDQLKGKRDD